MYNCFFFQAEDGIRDTSVTGVQTCALPISDVRAAIRAGTVRVLVDLRVAAGGPSAIVSTQDEALRRLAGSGARLVRRFATAPLLALEIDAPALARLEAMRDIVARVRVDRITPL